jgi:hypothetical protein
VREADHSSPSSAEVKKMSAAIPPLSNTPSWRGAQLKRSTGTTLPLPQGFYLHRRAEHRKMPVYIHNLSGIGTRDPSVNLIFSLL